jgi:large conductance mechanosensitive channel
MIQEFRAFLTKTNALALAIGVIIGAALGAVVNSLVNDIIMPPIGWALGGVNFSDLKIVLGTTTDAKGVVTEVAIRYGTFINTLIVFVVVAFVVFMIARTFIKEAEAAPVKACPFCKTDNAVDATKCKACASAI